MSERTVLLIHERPIDSLIKDAGTFVTVVAVVGLGWLISSEAMQWAGAIMFFLTMFAMAAGRASRNRCTVAEARQRLDEIDPPDEAFAGEADELPEEAR